jgi:hypothetical protein
MAKAPIHTVLMTCGRARAAGGGARRRGFRRARAQPCGGRATRRRTAPATQPCFCAPPSRPGAAAARLAAGRGGAAVGPARAGRGAAAAPRRAARRARCPRCPALTLARFMPPTHMPSSSDAYTVPSGPRTAPPGAPACAHAGAAATTRPKASARAVARPMRGNQCLDKLLRGGTEAPGGLRRRGRAQPAARPAGNAAGLRAMGAKGRANETKASTPAGAREMHGPARDAVGRRARGAAPRARPARDACGMRGTRGAGPGLPARRACHACRAACAAGAPPSRPRAREL